MGIVIDSDIFIEAERGRFDLEKLVSGRVEDVYLSAVSASELLNGVYRAKDQEAARKRGAFVESIIQQFIVLPVDLSVAYIHAKIVAELANRGESIGVQDSWIAATCLANRCTLITRNVREFRRVPLLNVEVW